MVPQICQVQYSQIWAWDVSHSLVMTPLYRRHVRFWDRRLWNWHVTEGLPYSGTCRATPAPFFAHFLLPRMMSCCFHHCKLELNKLCKFDAGRLFQLSSRKATTFLEMAVHRHFFIVRSFSSQKRQWATFNVDEGDALLAFSCYPPAVFLPHLY